MNKWPFIMSFYVVLPSVSTSKGKDKRWSFQQAEPYRSCESIVSAESSSLSTSPIYSYSPVPEPSTVHCPDQPPNIFVNHNSFRCNIYFSKFTAILMLTRQLLLLIFPPQFPRAYPSTISVWSFQLQYQPQN